MSELGSLNIEEHDLLAETISEEPGYQDDVNIAVSTRIPSGKIPRPKSKKFRGTEKNSTKQQTNTTVTSRQSSQVVLLLSPCLIAHY